MSIFSSVYYEPWKKKMHLWEIQDDGKTKYFTFDHDIKYYVLDKTGQSPIKSLDGLPVVKRYAKNKEAIHQLKDSGERVFESDLSEDIKFLHERYGDNNDDNIKIENFKIFNIDIETEFPDSPRINLIGIQDFHTKEIFQFGLHDYKGDFKCSTYIYCETEEILLERFCKFLKYKGCSILIGWNIMAFDIPEIQNRIDALNLKCSMSPIGKIFRDKFTNTIKIAGIEILDSMIFYKKFTQKNEPSFSLDYIGNLVVGEGKVGYEGTLSDLWKTDPEKFIVYNCQDLNLVKKIDEKMKFVELAIRLGITTRTPFEKVESSVATIEGYILRFLHRQNLVMEDITHNIAFEKTRSVTGGYVETHPGFYLKSANVDATSLYPFSIIMFNISKETKVLNPSEEEIPNLIKTPVKGVYYRKDVTGILASISQTIFNDRKKYKNLMFKCKKEKNYELASFYDMMQKVEKTKIVSIYGCCLEPHFHWFDFDNGSVITAVGRTAIQYMSKEMNQFLSVEFPKTAKDHYPNFNNKITNKNKIIVIDTDSVGPDSMIKTNLGDVSIEYIFNNYSENVIENGNDNYIANVNNLFSQSFNTDLEMLEQKPIEYIKKHKVQKRLFKIKHENDSVIVTEDHSIIVDRQGIFMEVSPKDIVLGDKIIKL